MDELEIEGKRYLSSRRAAKLHKYHIDYIGQLIRAGKINGKKVGRSWYVEEASLNTYLTQEAGGSAPEALPVEIEAVEPASVAAPLEPVFAEEVIYEPTGTADEPEESVPQEAAPAAPIAFANSLHAEQPIPMSKHSLHEAVRTSSASYEEREVHFTAQASVPVRKPSTLTYIEDHEPLLPVLEGRSRANADFVAIPVRRVEEDVRDTQEEDVAETEEEEHEPAAYAERKNNKKSFAFPRMEALVAAGVLVVAAAAIASAFLGTSIKVNEGQPASVVYTLK